MQIQRHFDDKRKRAEFHVKYGLRAYKPRLILVIGRTLDFRSETERIELAQFLPRDLEMWTYDDLLVRAKQFARFATSEGR